MLFEGLLYPSWRRELIKPIQYVVNVFVYCNNMIHCSHLYICRGWIHCCRVMHCKSWCTVTGWYTVTMRRLITSNNACRWLQVVPQLSAAVWQNTPMPWSWNSTHSSYHILHESGIQAQVNCIPCLGVSQSWIEVWEREAFSSEIQKVAGVRIQSLASRNWCPHFLHVSPWIFAVWLCPLHSSPLCCCLLSPGHQGTLCCYFLSLWAYLSRWRSPWDHLSSTPLWGIYTNAQVSGARS